MALQAFKLCQGRDGCVRQFAYDDKGVFGAPVCGPYGRCFAVVNSHSFSNVLPDLVQMSALELSSQALLVGLSGLAATDAALAHTLCFATHKCQVMHCPCSVQQRKTLKADL